MFTLSRKRTMRTATSNSKNTAPFLKRAVNTAIIAPLLLTGLPLQPVVAQDSSKQTSTSAGIILDNTKLPTQPFIREMHDGKPFIRHLLQLRSRKQLRELQKRKWAGGPYLNLHPAYFAVPKPGVKEADRQEALGFARDRLKDASRQIEEFLSAEGQAPVLSGRFFPDLKVVQDIFQAVGTREDETLLLDFVNLAKSAEIKKSWNTFEPSHMAIITGISIAMRLGSLEESAFVHQWRQMLDKNSGALFTSLTIELSKVGFQPALDVLIDAVAVKRSNADWGRRTNIAAFDLATQVEHPAVLALAIEIVKIFANDTEMTFKGEKEYYSTTEGGISVYSAFPSAFLYVAAYGSDDQQKLLSVGLTDTSPLAEMISYFVNPIDVLDSHFGASSKKFHKRYSFSICEMADGRNRQEFADLMTRYEVDFLDWYSQHNVKKEWRNHRAAASHWSRTIAYAMSQCMINPKAMGYLQGAYEHHLHQLPAYMLHASDKIQNQFPDFNKFPNASLKSLVFDHVDDGHFTKLINDANIASHPSVLAYQYRRKVATSAHFAKRTRYPGQDDERLFVQPVEIEAGKAKNYWIGGSIRLKPRISANRRLFGLEIDAFQHAKDGLASVIGKFYEKMAPLVADYGRALVEQVKLRHGDTDTSLEFQRTSNRGVHVFELKENVTSETNLVIDVYMKTVDRKWVVSFPLYASPLGFQKIYADGRISLAPQ